MPGRGHKEDIYRKMRKDDTGEARRRYTDFILNVMGRHPYFYSGFAINFVTLEMSFDFSMPN